MLTPKTKNAKTSFLLRTCIKCGQDFGAENYAPTRSPFFPGGHVTICNDCIEKDLAEHGYVWTYVDKMCQMADIPFVPKEWERIHEMAPNDTWGRYAAVFQSSEYEGLDWSDYYQAFRRLKENGGIEEELPEIAEQRARELREKWGANYDNEALQYLEGLFNGLMTTQNVNGALQIDQAKKICKMSYEVDRRIAEGSDFDKLLASYDKLVKAAEFTPKNVKNINDFDTVGELVKWLEKTGWENPYYDDVPKDVIDETMANIQANNRRLYTNESGIGEEITARLRALQQAEKLENEDSYYVQDFAPEALDDYEIEGFDSLEEFNPRGDTE